MVLFHSLIADTLSIPMYRKCLSTHSYNRHSVADTFVFESFFSNCYGILGARNSTTSPQMMTIFKSKRNFIENSRGRKETVSLTTRDLCTFTKLFYNFISNELLACATLHTETPLTFPRKSPFSLCGSRRRQQRSA